MLLIVLLWILIIFIFTVFGYSLFRLIGVFRKDKENTTTLHVEEYFFLGFLALSVLTGYLSILMPIGNYVLIGTIIISALLFLVNHKKLLNIFKDALTFVHGLKWAEIAILFFLLVFLLATVAQPITWGDTESYHVQTINWIRKYAVVPGLGNIHERFAFNSMFFIISGMATFRITDILIFPLNGICFFVLIVKLYVLGRQELFGGAKWKAVFYFITILISLLFLIPSLNSPSPDAICGIIIAYLFTLFIEGKWEMGKLDFSGILLINLIVFSCITFKLSSLFIIAVIVLSWNTFRMKDWISSLFLGFVIVTPFIIRNYFLSGYFIYPFPDLDIFRNIDWKVPYENVLSMKLEIEGWAKMSTIPYPEVLNMEIYEWILPWFKSQNFIGKMLLVINSFSIFSVCIMLYKRDFFLARIQMIIIINLLFWFVMAPDIRFAYGFFFIGFSLTIAYIIRLIEKSSYKVNLNLLVIGLACGLILVIGRRITRPIESLINPRCWIIPASFGSVETEIHATNFEYRVPVQRGGCFNTDIPCVPIPFDNVILRTTNIRDGFRVDTSVYSGIHYID